MVLKAISLLTCVTASMLFGYGTLSCVKWLVEHPQYVPDLKPLASSIDRHPILALVVAVLLWLAAFCMHSIAEDINERKRSS
jgi:hypothetical protein